MQLVDLPIGMDEYTVARYQFHASLECAASGPGLQPIWMVEVIPRTVRVMTGSTAGEIIDGPPVPGANIGAELRDAIRAGGRYAMQSVTLVTVRPSPDRGALALGGVCAVRV